MKPEQYRDQYPDSMKGTYDKAPTSRAMAIKAFCQNCVGFERKYIAECTDEGCPLFHWRPYVDHEDVRPTKPRKKMTAAHKKKLQAAREAANKRAKKK